LELGDKRTELFHYGEHKPSRKTGTVIYIHPKRRFYVVEFELAPGKFARESYYFPNRRAGEE